MPDKLTLPDMDTLKDAVNNDRKTWGARSVETARKILAACPVSLLIEEVQRRNIVVPECNARGGA